MKRDSVKDGLLSIREEVSHWITENDLYMLDIKRDRNHYLYLESMNRGLKEAVDRIDSLLYMESLNNEH